MPQVDYDKARQRLETEFGYVERTALQGDRVSIGDALEPHFDRIFESRTQAYREVLLGCVLARLQDSSIDVHKPYSILLAAEITERTVDKNRVTTTFQAKISKHAIQDYLFFVKDVAIDQKAVEQARKYFSQGHEVNFIVIRDWIRMLLATIGKAGRDAFCRNLTDALDHRDVPPTLKVAWNDQIAAITTS
ncbi:MAG: hypothetical protein R6V58_08920 [Planctomycetota bacterium]